VPRRRRSTRSTRPVLTSATPAARWRPSRYEHINPGYR
jgi:hypothetical protein